MNKKYLLIAGCIVLIFLAIFFFMPESNNPELNSPDTGQNMPTENKEEEKVETGNNQTQRVPTTQELWDIFSRYLRAAQNHDREALKMYSFALSQACSTSPVSEECTQRMDAVYEAGRVLSQSDFTSLWADDRQAILMSSAKETQDSQSFGFSRSVILFAKNKEGRFGLLALDPKRTWLVKKNATSSTEALRENATKYMMDSDQDGITDNFENCVFPDNLIVLSECTKTNPNLRDTDGDLWWDGISVYTKLFD